MNAWSLQRGATSPYRLKAKRPILRAHMQALRRNLLVAERSSAHYRVLAADLLRAHRPEANR
jgi:hypothetical protein